MLVWIVSAAFRKSFARAEQLFAAYGEQCDFVNIYISEAHPSDGWSFGADHPEQQAWVGVQTDREPAKAEYDKWGQATHDHRYVCNNAWKDNNVGPGQLPY